MNPAVESAHRGTFPVPLRAGHIKDQPSLERLRHNALFGTNSRFFMYQVSYLNGTKCYRSSNVMLLRVSCPISKRQMVECLEHTSLCFVDALLFSLYDGCLTLSQVLLLLSRDVELNPGPMNAVERDQMTNIERILLEMKTGQETVLAKLTEITTRQCEIGSKITGLIEKTNNVESRNARVEKMEDKFMAKLDDLENRSRRQNLVFFGLPVFKNAYILKGTSYSISEDFSRAVQEKRRQLWNYAKEKRQNKENHVRLSYDKLIINGQTFVWDSDMRMPVPLQPERLSVLPVNCRSIKNKVDNLISLVATVKPQTVMGTESWLDKDIPDVEIFPPGFTVYRKDRHGHGGGVFILISNAISGTQILFENDSESVWCLVKLPNGNNVVYGTFYRPPGSSDSFALLSEMLSLLPNSVFLGEDFNLPDFNWNAGCVAGKRSRMYTEFEELLGLNGLQQYVLEPTRENAILDFVLCNEPNIISKVTVCPGISDHRAVVIELNIQRVRMAQIPQSVQLR
ncbi:uncharacterized protein [Dermacentor andersoni]|uniref:uncharacterized protein n=1 Tax=Dermacentor andersoni TaxID=34620 RepID=UPI0024165ECD|nr:uncharacterized protein LOC126516618 [Dermacentor andersoni]